MEELIGELLNDANTFYLSLTGVMISIIILLYSLAIGKKDELSIISDVIKRGSKDPCIISRKSFIIRNINKLRKYINYCFGVLICSLICLCVGWVGVRFFPNNYHKYIIMFIGIITFILIIFVLLSIPIIKRFLNRLNV